MTTPEDQTTPDMDNLKEQVYTVGKEVKSAHKQYRVPLRTFFLS